MLIPKEEKPHIIFDVDKMRSIMKPKEALKNDDDKLQYQLIPTYGLKQVARVFTFGASKYGVDNWKKGFKWTRLIGAMKRHIADFEAGMDIDPESGIYHLAHALTNGLMLLDYHRTHPELDDRYKPYMHERRIVLDVDDVVADFAGAYKKKFGEAAHNYWDFTYGMSDNLKKLIENEEEGKDFFVNLPVKHRPNFIPHAYVSSRSIPVEWTKEFLEKNGLPCRPVYHVPFNTSKVEVLRKIGAEFLIDDKFQNFREAQAAGITAFLMDAEHNQHHEVGYRRLKDLDIKNIAR